MSSKQAVTMIVSPCGDVSYFYNDGTRFYGINREDWQEVDPLTEDGEVLAHLRFACLLWNELRHGTPLPLAILEARRIDNVLD